jgi:hypothetical protein
MRSKEIVMPTVMHRGDKPGPTQKPAGPSAAANKKTSVGSSDTPNLLPKILIGGVVVAILFALFMYHQFVNPLVPGGRSLTKVAPLPGFRDEFPYNTKEWQEKYKAGKAGFVSGVPRMAGPPAGGGQQGAP